MELKKNQLHTAEITGYTSEGVGVCRIEGRAVFVKHTIVGEVWEIRILKVTRSAVYGKAERCLGVSDSRQEPPCPVYRKCGGCALLHMDYEAEKQMKLGRINDALKHIGRLEFQVSEIIGAEQTEHYRNKAIYAVGMVGGKVCKGFYRVGTHEITPVDRCLLQTELSDQAADAVCDWMNQHDVLPYDEQTGKGTVRHIFTRTAKHTSDAVLTIVTARGFGAETEDLVAFIRENCPALTGIVLCVNKQKGNVVLAGDFYTLWGKAEMTDTLCGLCFEIAPQAFFQVNPKQAERLYEKAEEYAVHSPADTVLDLYCGAGTISLCLAKKAGRVIGAEIVPEAIENAKANAERNGVTNAEFLCADAGAAAKTFAEAGIHPDCIVVDPPRKGLSEEALLTIASMNPERIVYVSCDPGTLARDLKLLTIRGYSPAQGVGVDMFPHSHHIETAIQLLRNAL